MQTRLWEIRLVDGTSVLVEASKDRNLATELELLAARWWQRYWTPDAEVRVLKTTVAVVQPYEPAELRQKIAMHDPNHPQKRQRRTVVAGFTKGAKGA